MLKKEQIMWPIIQSPELGAGGVFWLNAVGKEGGEEGFQPARNTFKPDNSWRRPIGEGDFSVPVKNRYGALQEVEGSEKGRYYQGKITIDSGACDCVMPRYDLGNLFPLLPKKEGVRFRAANGSVIESYGRRNVAFKTDGRRGVNCVTFHVTDVKKPLASVSKIVEKGSSVHFTPEGSYIQGPSGERIDLSLEGGVYVMDVTFVEGFKGQA